MVTSFSNYLERQNYFFSVNFPKGNVMFVAFFSFLNLYRVFLNFTENRLVQHKKVSPVENVIMHEWIG